MKKSFIALVLCALLVAMTVFPTAAASASVSANSTVKEGDKIVFTFAITQNNVKSGAVDISFPSANFELVSGEWVLGNTLLTDYSGSRGVFTLKSAANFSGKAVFKLTLKALKATKSATVTAKFTLKDTNGDTLSTPSKSKDIQITCKSHSFGDWTTKDATCTKDGSKTRTCSVCGTKETQTLKAAGHKVSSMKVTKEPTCTATGTESGTCSVCGNTVTQTIAMKEHTYDEWNIVTAPTCTETGSQTKTCSVCGNTVTEEIPANGHDFGAWVLLTPSTCSAAGDEAATCKVCGAEEHREAELAPHDFGGVMTVERPATISVPGLVSGTCVNCGARTEQETPCSVTDEDTQAVITAEEGTFRVGTEVDVTRELPESEKSLAVAEALANTTDKFEIYNVDATVDGAKVAPNGQTVVTLPVPEDFSSVIGAMLVNEDGTTEMLGTRAGEDGKTVEVATDKLGSIVLMDLSPVRPEPEKPERSFTTGQTVGLAGGFSLIMLPIGIIIGRTSKKGKKDEE